MLRGARGKSVISCDVNFNVSAPNFLLRKIFTRIPAVPTPC
jgi:hypothetical protein